MYQLQLYSCSLRLHNTHLKYKMLIVHIISLDYNLCTSVHTSVSRECGFTGLSILHRLHSLYGFNTLVYDAMHNVQMNVASNHLHYYLNEGIVTAQLEDGLKSRLNGHQVIYSVIHPSMQSSDYDIMSQL